MEMNPQEHWCIKEEDWKRIKADLSSQSHLYDMVEAGELVLIVNEAGNVLSTLGIEENRKFKELKVK